MPSPALWMSLLLAVAFSLATWLEPRYVKWGGSRAQSDDMMTVALGDSRRMFANHFFVKADVYFHSGYYPTIFDGKKIEEKSHMLERDEDDDARGKPGEHSGQGHEEEQEGDFLGPPRDWIDAFGRHFYKSKHTHLHGEGAEREILPWLRISADLDPHRIETYTVASYWLRTQLNKPKEAEQFLREGLRENPDSYEILQELGQIYYTYYKDIPHARNIWELALKRWYARESHKETPDKLAYEEIVAHLAGLEEKAENWPKCVEYLEMLKKVSPIADRIEKQIQDIKQKHHLQ